MGTPEQNWIAAVANRKQSGFGNVSLRKSATGTFAELTNRSPRLAIDASKMCVTHILVTKSVDRQGDVVDPAGCDFSTHQLNPVVYYDHKSSYNLPIAKGSDGSQYTVRKSADGTLIYADTYFTDKNQMSNQLFGLVEADIINGWSVGFNPKPNGFEVIRKSNGKHDRGEYFWKSYDLLEYSLTPDAINPDATTVLCEKGRFNGEQLDPVILKSLSAHTIRNRAAIVSVPNHPLVNKAMQPQDDAPAGDPNADPYATDDQNPEGQAEETPTVAALYDAAQGVLDICSSLQNAVAKSEHKGGKSFASSACDAMQKLAGKIKAKAEAIKSELGGESDEPKESEPDGDESIETDDEGTMQTKSGYKPKRVRFTFEHIRKANEAKPQDSTSAAEIAVLKQTLESITKKLSAVA